jgi:hypothetical protein
VVGLGAAILFASYFLQILVPLFDWPNALTYLSVFKLYGSPLLDGPDWVLVGSLLAITLSEMAGGIALFERRDIAR